MSPKRIRHLQAQKVTPVAQRNVRFEGQLADQGSPKLCTRPWLTNNKGARRSYVYNIIVAQFPGEGAGAKGSVSANIDASEEDDESHVGIMKKKAARRHARIGFATQRVIAHAKTCNRH